MYIFAASGIHSQVINELKNPIDTSTTIATVDKVHESTFTSSEEVVNHASNQLFAYISANTKKRQKQAKKSITSSIILDDAQSVDSTKTNWWIEKLNLLDSDKETLISGAWLNASIITACQVILANQFKSKSGFQDVVHGILMNFTIQSQRFIQILHDADRNHWVAFSKQ